MSPTKRKAKTRSRKLTALKNLRRIRRRNPQADENASTVILPEISPNSTKKASTSISLPISLSDLNKPSTSKGISGSRASPLALPLNTSSSDDGDNKAEASKHLGDFFKIPQEFGGYEVNASSDEEFEMETESSNVEQIQSVPAGRRIVDITYLFQQLSELNDHKPFDCNFSNMAMVNEKRDGLVSRFTFRCKMCNIKKSLATEDCEDNSQMNLNSAAVLAAVTTGSGHAEMEQQHAVLNIPFMSYRIYSKHHRIISQTIFETVYGSMEEAGKEELRLAEEVGEIDLDGNGLITVIADGAWSKRSYKVNYDALSGVACIVGARTGKLLFMACRNRYCPTCAKAEKSNATASQHNCFKNWTGSSTSMEADIIVEGFRRSIEMHKLKYIRLVGDGDSSVYNKITMVKPYGPKVVVSKIECTNHLLRNYCNRLRELSKKKTSTQNKLVSIQLRKTLSNNILRLRTGIKSAIKYYRQNNNHLSVTEKCDLLKEDIRNCPHHVFGDHEKCKSYYCKGKKPGEKNLIPDLAASGLLNDILLSGNRLSHNVYSLLLNMNNNAAESYNSVVAKFTGGKRINFSVTNSFTTRCQAAAVRYNTKSEYYSRIHKKLTGKSPGKFTKLFMEKQKKIQAYRKSRQALFPPIKKKRTSAPPDEDYGLEEMDAEELQRRKNEFLDFIKKNKEELKVLELKTRGQSGNPMWKEERSFRLTASRFGEVCKLRKNTNPKNMLQRIIRPKFRGSAATQWGQDHEEIARKEFEIKFNVKVKNCGLFILEEYPYLGASPDGIVDEESLIEIKCPYAARTVSPEEAVDRKMIKYLQKNSSGNYSLKKTENYFFQVQGQLAISERRYCYFVVWTPLGMLVEKIEKDETFWQGMVPKLTDFYINHLLKELVKK